MNTTITRAEAYVAGRRVALTDAVVEDAVATVAAAAPAVRALSAFERAAILDRLAAALAADVESLADELVDEARFLTRADMVLEVQRAVDVVTLTAAAVREGFDDVVNLDASARGRGAIGIVKRVPKGPLLAITAFNGPILIATHKIAPAIAAGVPVVLKPSPRVPRAAVAFAEVVVAAGWPAEALAVLPVGNEATMQLVRDPRLPVISFTGGPVGWTFRDAAPRKHVHLEMGGVGATLVAADADLDEAVEQCMVGGFVRSGQACLSVQRIFVERPVYDEVVTRLADRVATLAAGDPTDPGTQVGPLVDEAAAERVTRLVDDAAGRGARVCCGGTREGALVTPTFLADVPDGAQLLRTEAFGPVMVAVCVDRLEDAVDEANAVGGALQVGVFTRDLDRALGLADLLDAGSVIVNGSNAWRIDTMPFGGTGVAGSGREGVRWMVEELTQTKVVVLRRTG